MRIDVLTIFPGTLAPFLNESILGLAQKKGSVQFALHNMRDYAADNRKTVDDRPYGGGPGMVMRPEPVFAAVEDVIGKCPVPGRLILLTPQGVLFDQALANEFSREERLVLICGRYEGFDERIRLGLKPEEISIGDFVLAGGEAAALVIIEAVVRLLPGVLGNRDSTGPESFQSRLLDYPQYTRPPEFRGMKVPDILLRGDHEAIARWRKEESILRTRSRRADLLTHRDSNSRAT